MRLADPMASVGEYQAAGGGEALAAALTAPPGEVIAEVIRSGLRGRGGAGYPTGAKWQTVRADPCPVRYLVGNAAEGEPGTFKDRWLLRRNPYQVLEGIAIAAHAIGARAAFIVIKRGFTREIGALARAMREMTGAGLTGPAPVSIVPGPGGYLFGEEKAAAEVVEGGEPLPRILPPYRVGLFARPGSANPTVTNNVETLANVPAIVRDGAATFRATGTGDSPGTMIFTLCGDVRRPGVYELPLGTPLLSLLSGCGGGSRDGRKLKAVFPGASNAILTPPQFGTPLDFEAMRAAGSGLGSGGFIAYDQTACIVAATLAFSRFLAAESCGQCPACTKGTGEITAALERIEGGTGSPADVATIVARCASVTGGQRCALPTGEARLVESAIRQFRPEFDAHLGRGCPRPRDLPLPVLADFDQAASRFRYARAS
jgi:NADH:ubiquinone oxidoreductase subunit F (NADH-binding)